KMKKIIPKDANLIPDSAKRVFKGKIFEVWQWPQDMYDNSKETFEMLKRPDTVVVLAIKDGKFIILRQSQPNLKNEFLDFPGGRADPGETPLESAKRELLEETGMTFKNWRLLNVNQPMQKIEWFIYTYLATDFENQVNTNHDAGEKIEILAMSFDEIKNIDAELARFDQDIFNTHGSIEDLIKAPEFQGRDIELA
ncbi:MAG TPA: NUDIX hydrolase, partial [Candidatus Binatia bacterium]|nr:NUDIX hydrolase [Candidatus Binatia bacterium]